MRFYCFFCSIFIKKQLSYVSALLYLIRRSLYGYIDVVFHKTQQRGAANRTPYSDLLIPDAYLHPLHRSQLVQTVSFDLVAGFLSFKYEPVIAPVGQARLQSPQRMHSRLFMFLSTSTFILQALSQAVQPVHVSLST